MIYSNQSDPRNIESGFPIPSEGYCDQPYIVKRSDGAWVCVVTVSSGEEGAVSQHIISQISTDCGQSWSKAADIEPAGPPEASWAMPYITACGRIYVFYTYNIDNMRSVAFGHEGGTTDRVDTLGAMMFKYSDDGGESWSKKHYRVPVRSFQIDLENPYDGRVQFFWGVSKPINHKGAMILGFSKVGWFGEGFMEHDEGAFIRCPNIETESDPEKLVFETLPEGLYGLHGPVGKIADEHNLVSLNSGDLFCTFRTVSSHNCQSYSRDDGKSWSRGEFFQKYPGGPYFKHPRACPALRKLSDGRYLLWFHAHGKDYTADPGGAYVGRNPVFLSGGIEKNGKLYWSEPEIILYSKNRTDRMSYPDFIEDHGEIYVTETQKTVARTHKIDRVLIENMFKGLEGTLPEPTDAVWSHDRLIGPPPLDAVGKLPLTELIPGRGDSFSLQLTLDTARLTPGLLIGGAVSLTYAPDQTLILSFTDGRTVSQWESDRLHNGRNTVTVIVDGQSETISYVLNGRFADGGESRDYGFGWIEPDMGNILSDGHLIFPASRKSAISYLRFYNRALTVAQSVAYDREKKS